MRRREFVAMVGAAIAAPLAGAQPAARVHRIGVLGLISRDSLPAFDAFTQRLRELGYVEGQNLVIDFRSAERNLALLPGLAQELVRGRFDVILTGINPTTIAARQATQSIPIVMATGNDVVREGLVASLARPGGNVTGMLWDAGLDIYAKRVQLLKEAVPRISRLAVMRTSAQEGLPTFRPYVETVEKAAATLGLHPIRMVVKDEHDLERAFAAAAREKADALFNLGSATLYSFRKQIVDLAAKYRLPDAHFDGSFVDVGGLMSYNPSVPDLYRKAAGYVDRILKGAMPSDLPVEQPTVFILAINLKTAKQLGVRIPQSLLLRADRVIE